MAIAFRQPYCKNSMLQYEIVEDITTIKKKGLQGDKVFFCCGKPIAEINLSCACRKSSAKVTHLNSLSIKNFTRIIMIMYF